MSRQDNLNRVCEYRKLPSLKIGMECEVDGKRGIIVGGNCSANLNVLFDGENHYNNCHPGYRMRIFNGMGGFCYESDDLYTAPCPEHERGVNAQPSELEKWELFRAEMLEHKKQLGKLAKNFLELEAFDSAAECAIKADGIKYVIGRMPKAH